LDGNTFNKIHMKKNIFLIAFFVIGTVVITTSSCTKYDGNDYPNGFDVSTTKLTYKVGDSVMFNFSGQPDEITFYSGESGKQYANINRNTATGINKLIFQTSMQQGVLPGNDSLQLYISTNLKGYDANSIQNATWTNITSRNTKWPTTLATTFTTSDSINISDFNTSDSINIAFRVLGKKDPVNPQRKWQIQNLVLTNNQTDGTLYQLFSAPFAGTANASSFQYTGWVQASIKNNTLPGFNAWNVGTGGISTADSIRNSNGIAIKTAYPIQFDPGVTANNDDNDDWLITTKTSLKTIRPDAGVTIKNEVNAAFAGLEYVYNKIPGIYARYLYKYTTPGIYNVTYVASNLNQNNKQTVIKTIQLTITP
jgi:hypothetical protein